MRVLECDRRTVRRREFAYPVFLDLGDDRDNVECQFLDISRDGARLVCSDVLQDVPGTVILKFSETGPAKRLCIVAWATRTEIGLRFIRLDEGRRRPVYQAPLELV